MILKSIFILFITKCLAKDLAQNPNHAILHENIQPSTEPSNVPVDYYDSINLPSPDYKFSYLYVQKRNNEEPQIEQREEEIGKYMNFQQSTTTPATTTTELQQHIKELNEKEKEQDVNYAQSKSSTKALERHHHRLTEEVTSTMPPMPSPPKLHTNKRPHFPPNFWDYLNNHRSPIPANLIHRHQSSTGTLKWNKSPKSDGSDLTGLYFPIHEWNPTRMRYRGHHKVHVSSTTSEAPIIESSTASELHLSTHDSKPIHLRHHEVNASPTTTEIQVEMNSVSMGLNLSTHESETNNLMHLSHHKANLYPTTPEITVEESSASTGLHFLAHDTKPNHVRHPGYHDVNELPATTEIPVEESSASTELRLSTHDSKPHLLRHHNHHHVHKLPTTSEIVEKTTISTEAQLSSHDSPNHLKDPNHHELHISPTTPEIPAKESSAEIDLHSSSHESHPHHLDHPNHHEVHTSPTTSDIPVSEFSTSHTLHTNVVSTQKPVPITSQHVPPLRRQNGHVKVNKRVKKVKNSPTVGHTPRPVYRGSYKFRLDDVNDMHTSPTRRITPAKASHSHHMISAPPPVPTLSPWYDGFGK